MLISVDDYRDVGGLRLPFHEPISENGQLMSETHYQSIQLNAPFTSADFKK